MIRLNAVLYGAAKALRVVLAIGLLAAAALFIGGDTDLGLLVLIGMVPLAGIVALAGGGIRGGARADGSYANPALPPNDRVNYS